MPRLGASLTAGSIAIVINTLALKCADYVPLTTARGGLLRLLSLWLSSILQKVGLASVWSSVGLPSANTPIFQTGFHLVVGLIMALFYAYFLEPFLAVNDFIKGLIFAITVWLLNAFVVLPATGEGIAGSAHLTFAGMAWFAAAHTVFFIVLALLYGRMKGGETASRSIIALAQSGPDRER